MSPPEKHADGHLRWDLILFTALASLQTENSRARLGMLWWILDPLLYLSIFYLVFAVVMQRGGPDFVIKLLIGLVLWRWFDNCTKSCSDSMIRGAGLMRQVYVSKLLFPLSAVLTQSIKFLFVLAVFLTGFGIYQGGLSWEWLNLLPLLIAELTLISGLGLLTASLVPFLPDLKVLIAYALQLGFFVSGVFFDISRVPESIREWLYLNPVAALIDQARVILLTDATPDWVALGLITLVGVVMAIAGAGIIVRFDRHYPALLTP